MGESSFLDVLVNELCERGLVWKLDTKVGNEIVGFSWVHVFVDPKHMVRCEITYRVRSGLLTLNVLGVGSRFNVVNPDFIEELVSKLQEYRVEDNCGSIK